MAIWLRAREEFTDNRFQLLFIYIDVATSMSVRKCNIGNCNIKVCRYECAIGWSAETMQDFRP